MTNRLNLFAFECFSSCHSQKTLACPFRLLLFFFRFHSGRNSRNEMKLGVSVIFFIHSLFICSTSFQKFGESVGTSWSALYLNIEIGQLFKQLVNLAQCCLYARLNVKNSGSDLWFVRNVICFYRIRKIRFVQVPVEEYTFLIQFFEIIFWPHSRSEMRKKSVSRFCFSVDAKIHQDSVYMRPLGQKFGK